MGARVTGACRAAAALPAAGAASGLGAAAVLVERALELPALVRPGPVAGRGADLLLHPARVTLGQRPRGQGLCGAGERFEVHFVVAARGAAHGDEEHRKARHTSDFLRPQVKGGVAVEKTGPVLVLA